MSGNQKKVWESSNIPQLWREALDYAAEHPKTAAVAKERKRPLKKTAFVKLLLSLIRRRPVHP